MISLQVFCQLPTGCVPLALVRRALQNSLPLDTPDRASKNAVFFPHPLSDRCVRLVSEHGPVFRVCLPHSVHTEHMARVRSRRLRGSHRWCRLCEHILQDIDRSITRSDSWLVVMSSRFDCRFLNVTVNSPWAWHRWVTRSASPLQVYWPFRCTTLFAVRLQWRDFLFLSITLH